MLIKNEFIDNFAIDKNRVLSYNDRLLCLYVNGKKKCHSMAKSIKAVSLLNDHVVVLDVDGSLNVYNIYDNNKINVYNIVESIKDVMELASAGNSTSFKSKDLTCKSIKDLNNPLIDIVKISRSAHEKTMMKARFLRQFFKINDKLIVEDMK